MGDTVDFPGLLVFIFGLMYFYGGVCRHLRHLVVNNGKEWSGSRL